MVSLGDLKKRLAELPEKRKQAELSAVYTAHLDKTIAARQKVKQTLARSKYANEVLPNARYAAAIASATKAVQQAARLNEKISTNPDSIAEDSVDRGFIALNDNAVNASRVCVEAWTKEVEDKVRDWAMFVDVLNRLDERQGRRLRSAVSALQGCKNNPPEDKASTGQVQKQLDDLSDIVASLGLKDEFGRFLRAANSSQGADLKAALNPKVQEKIGDLKLWDFFRIKLPT